jgi:hypothetical protein
MFDIITPVYLNSIYINLLGDIMANGTTKGNRPTLGSSLEALNASNPLNARKGNETVTTTQDYKRDMKSKEELDDLR